jgi:toxin CptA
MHNAPAVSYPVGRSHFQGGLLLAAGLAGLASCVAWALADARLGLRQILALSLWALVSVNAFWHWRQTPTGVLHWDGQVWRLELTPPVANLPLDASSRLSVQLDFQSVILARLGVEGGGDHWLWLQAQADPSRWRALRRAAHGRVAAASSPSGAAAQPQGAPP